MSAWNDDCPECEGRGYFVVYARGNQVSRDMAIDAGMPEIEGSYMGDEPEQQQCELCECEGRVMLEVSRGVGCEGNCQTNDPCDICIDEGRPLTEDECMELKLTSEAYEGHASTTDKAWIECHGIGKLVEQYLGLKSNPMTHLTYNGQPVHLRPYRESDHA